jgi:hypothetical protein
MNADTKHPTASWARRGLAKTGVGIGVAVSVLATAGVATAAPGHAAQPSRASTVVTATNAAAKPYSSVTVSQHLVKAGQRVTISGNGPKNAHAGSWITLQSDAFASKTTVNGIPAIRTQVLVNGKYSATATIRHGLKQTNYAIAGSFNGKSLDTVAWVTVH